MVLESEHRKPTAPSPLQSMHVRCFVATLPLVDAFADGVAARVRGCGHWSTVLIGCAHTVRTM